MPARFYHILAYTYPPPPDPRDLWAYQPAYLGNTKDLIFKTEPELSVDLDDGSTLVGAEKLTVSFSFIGIPDNLPPIYKLLLVPAIGPVTGRANPVLSNNAPIEIELNGEDDYTFETKTADFEMTHFSATLRYPTNAIPYSMLSNFFNDFKVILWDNGQTNADFSIWSKDEEVACTIPMKYKFHPVWNAFILQANLPWPYIIYEFDMDIDPAINGVIHLKTPLL